MLQFDALLVTEPLNTSSVTPITDIVDCELYDLSRISNDVRVKIINYIMENKNVRARDLGVTLNLISMIRSGKRRVTEDLLCRAMAYLSSDELAKLLGELPELEPATVNDIIKVVVRARADPAFRELLLSYLDRYLGEYIRSVGRQWVVTKEDIDAYIKAMRLKGIKEKTLRDRLHYIQRALSEMNWVLSPEGIRDYLASIIEEESPHVVRHITVSLKSFIKNTLQAKDPGLFAILYNSFRTIKPKNHGKVKLPTIEELKQILQRIESIETKTYFLILAETGLRPSEPFLVSMDDIDLEHGMLRIGKVEETKRSFIAFLRPETIDFIKNQYLPYRDRFLSMIVKGMEAAEWSRNYVDNLKQRFLPFDQGRLRREIKDSARHVLGREFELYELRKFFATWMISRGVPESIVNTLQGRAPPTEYRVLIEHYWSPRHEELRQWYLRHAPCLLC
ncbi:integrase [Vulcanisaeta souniana JCM 11219]|uniref:Integrase n=1 Tax=Vulcanisaeta souniana JCM 11219 TaxID=1293586 RepID=A0A830E7W0_9CREN|nr:integrase [Vulcanisaeta souniana JCM 11219]